MPATEISTLPHIPFDIAAIHAARGAFVDTESTKIKLAPWKISGHLESHITSQMKSVIKRTIIRPGKNLLEY